MLWADFKSGSLKCGTIFRTVVLWKLLTFKQVLESQIIDCRVTNKEEKASL